MRMLKLGFPVLAIVAWMGLAMPEQSRADSDMPACTVCHMNVNRHQYKHEPSVMDCSFCHILHPEKTDNPKRLIKQPNELCLDCHDSNKMRLSTGHVVQNHPVYREVDPIMEEFGVTKPFNCVSCHSPHSTRSPKLFRFDYSKYTPYNEKLCAVCHYRHYTGNTDWMPKPKPEPEDYE